MKKSSYKADRRTDAASSIILPVDFTPGIYDVIIGRGRRCTEHYGNLRFKSIVEYELDGYSVAECKRQKSSIIARVLGLVKENNSAGFVKKDVASGRWLSLNQAASRVTIAQAFRDACQDSYRSSKKAKQVKRRIQKEAVVKKAPPEAASSKPEAAGKTARAPPAPVLFEDDTEAILDDDLEEIGEDFFEQDIEPLPVIMEEEQSTGVLSEDALTCLLDTFASHPDLNDNPYEPIPFAPSEAEIQQQRSKPLKVLRKEKMPHQAGRFGRPAPSRTVCAAMSA